MRIPIIKKGNLRKQIDKVDEKLFELLINLDKDNERKALTKAYDLVATVLAVVDTLEIKVGRKRRSWENAFRRRIKVDKLEVCGYMTLNEKEV